MSNFDTARDALETSLNSAGSAMREHEKWQQSLEARINSLKASWQGLSQTFLKSDFLKVGIDLIIKLVDGITLLIDKVGVLPTLLGAFAAFKGIGAISSTAGAVGGLKSFADILSVITLAFPNAAKGMGIFTAALKGGVGIVGILKAALQGLWTVVAAHPILAVVAAVGLVVTAFIKFGNNAEELAKKVDELTDKYKQNHEELKKLKGDFDTSNESSMISKYEKLSKGVDGLGKNISLTAEEYSEYQSIVNKIAEQFPSLVSGYDSQGNAILSCKGNVEALTTEYEKLIHAQNQVILSQNNGDIEKNWKNALEKANGYGFWENAGNSLSVDGVFGGKMDIYDMKVGTAKWLEGLNRTTSVKDIKDGLRTDSYRRAEVIQALQNAGYDVNLYSDISKVLKNILDKEPQKIKGILDNYYAQFDDAVTTYKTKATALLSEAFDVRSSISGLNYDNISEELQSIAYQTVNSLDFDFLNNLTENGTTIDQWVKNMLNQLNALSESDNKRIETGFELQTKFNGGDISYGQYIDQLQETVGFVDNLKLPDEVKNQIKLSLNSEDVLADYNALVHDLKNIGFDDVAIDSFLNSLSAEEFSAAMKIIPDLEAGTTIKEIQALIDEQLATEFKFDITVQTEGLEAFNTALTESRSAAGLTSESIAALKARYEDLDGFNAAALFEKTANGIHLNSEELSRLEEQYVATNKLEIDKNLSKLVEKYNNLTEEIKSCTDAQEKENLQLQADAYKDKIDELSTLASQYDGLTSAFAKWQTALDGAEEGDNYDSLYENLEGIKELYDKGLVGTDKFKTAVQLMTSKDLSNADIDEITAAYKKGYPKMQRYFTEGQKGCKNFLNDVSKLNSEWAHMNKDGSWEINFNAEEVAKELGVSVDFVLQIAKKLKDYGFEVNLEDSSVDNLKTKIEQTEAKLKELGQSPVDINVDIDASSANLSKIEFEIEKAKNKIKEINSSSVDPKIKTAQLEDARAKLEALIDKKQEVSQPAFMNLNTSQVNASLVDALDKIQSYQNAINEVNKLSELKEAGITIDDSQLQTAKEKVDECAKAIQGLDGEVKMAIGLEEDGSIDSIKKSFEEGKVKIDANTDPALTKIEQLAENVERIEDKDVTINVTVNGLDKVKELNKQIDLATDIDGDIDKLSEYVESAKTLNELGGNIASYVTAEVKGNVLDKKDKELKKLKIFADNTKDLKSDNIISNVTANTLGSVFEEKEKNIDNLKVFIDSAKGIKDIEGDIVSNITANTLGSVFEDKEKNIDNIKTFIDSAKGIKDIEGDIVSNITANTLGSVFENKNEEKYINNLKTYIDSAKGIKDIEGNIISNITANTLGSVFEDKEKSIDNLKVFIESANGIKDIEGDIVSNITANTLGSVFENKNEEKYINNLKTFVDSAKGIKDIEGDIVSNITANTLGSVFENKNEDKYIDNLKTFVNSAKGIKEIEGNIISNITANTLGSVFEDKEKSIDNLDVFIDSAKGIKDIEGNITSNITANTLGSVFEDTEKTIDNLSVFVKSAKGIKDIEGNITSNITANTLGSVFENKNEEKYINNLKTFVDSAKGIKDIESKTVNITANTLGDVFEEKEKSIDNLKVFAEGAKALQNVNSKTVNITANTSGDVFKEKEKSIDNLKVFAEGAKALQGAESKTVNITANANGNVISGDGASGRLSSLTEFKSLVNGMTNQNITVSVTAKVDSENVNAAIDLLKKVSNSGVFKDYNATVQVGAKIATIDDTTVKNYQAPKKDGKVAYSVDPESSVYTWTAPSKDGVVNYSASVEALTDAQKHKTGTITYKAKVEGGGVVNGTANANGSANGRAFSRGNWGIKGSGVALGGELGRELVVRDGRFFTIGDEGAQFFHYKKNDIIFNAAQTESLFKYGGIKGANPRGRMFANGTAYAEGSAFVSGSGTFKDEESDISSNSSEDKFEEVLDWVEIILDRVERSIDRFDQQANNIYKSWSSRNTALQNQISEVDNEIGLQQKAYSQYMQEANSVGLPSSWASKVRNGEFDISTITDEDLADKIGRYQDWYEKALACQDAIEELKETEASLYAQRFENIQTQYDGILQGYEHTASMLNEYISQAEEKGHIVSKKYYNALIDNEKSNIAELKKEQSALIAERDNAVAAGKIVKGSQAWREQCEAIDSVTQSIEEANTALIEYSNSIREIEWQVFDLIQERISDITSESEFLIELMSNDKLFDDNGKLTDKGMATIGLHSQNYGTAMYQADEYKKEIAKIEEQLKSDPYDQELINRRQELLELQRESIIASEQEKQSIKDLVSEGIEKELDALQERIDLRTEELESTKDIYDYQKNVQEQSAEIANLEKQRAAYLSDTSAEGQAKLQEITVSLKEAKDDLFETEFDRYIDQQEQLLSSLYDEYELTLNTRLDDINALISGVIDEVNANADTISNTLTNVTTDVGYILSAQMSDIWNSDGAANKVIALYGDKITGTEGTTLQTVLNSIKADVGRMVDDVDKDATTKVASDKTVTSVKKEPTKTTTTTKPTTTNTSNSIKVGDEINASGAQIYDHAGDTSGERQLYRNDPIYKVLKTNGNWVQVLWHKLSSGITGWFKKSDVKAYATGKKIFSDDEIAWTQEKGQEFIIRPSDGAILTPVAKGDSILTSAASSNIWDMANSPAEFIKDNLNLGVANAPNNSTVQNNCVQNFEKIVFSMPNVKNYGELLSELQKDPKFDKLVKAITVDQIAGKSSLAKNKSIR